MTNEQKNLLKPHAEHFIDIAVFIAKCDVNELAALKEASEAASVDNCGWAIYHAARYMLREIEAEQYKRLRSRAASADAATA